MGRASRRTGVVAVSNPFYGAVDDALRGRRARVAKSDGTAYIGWVDRLHHNQRSVLLRDATRCDDGADVGAVFVAHAETIAMVDAHERIERVALDAVSPAPYHAREFAVAENEQYIAEVLDHGWSGSFPVVRERDGGTYEVVEGHKRLWAAEQAGLEEHPVAVVDIDAWTAARRFVVDHIPAAGEQAADGYYDDPAIARAIPTLNAKWGERVREFDRVVAHADRLGIVLDGDGAEDAAENVTSTDDPAETVTCGVDDCDYTTDSERGLAIHQARSHVTCDDCDAVFATERGLSIHRGHAHKASGEKYDSDNTLADAEADADEADAEATEASDEDKAAGPTADRPDDTAAADGGVSAAVSDAANPADGPTPDAGEVFARHDVARDEVVDVAEDAEYLADLADALALDEQAARAVAVRANVYADLREGAAYTGGGGGV